MAEDRNLATARATDPTDDDDMTKAELQRRMEQAREAITQTVTEIKDTVTNQYQSVRETINETLDWREQFRKRPVAWSVGALSVGFMTGYCIAANLKGDGGGRNDYPSYEETDIWNVGTPVAAPSSGRAAEAAPSRSYAAQAVTGGAHGSTEYAQAAGDESQAGYGSLSTKAAAAEVEQPSGPSLIERFKETKAFDRLQDEVSKLGDRFIDQLSSVGQEVVLPALFGKIKELLGVDLSDKQKQERGAQNKAVSAMGGLSTDDQRTQGGAA